MTSLKYHQIPSAPQNTIETCKRYRKVALRHVSANSSVSVLHSFILRRRAQRRPLARAPPPSRSVAASPCACCQLERSRPARRRPCFAKLVISTPPRGSRSPAKCSSARATTPRRQTPSSVAVRTTAINGQLRQRSSSPAHGSANGSSPCATTPRRRTPSPVAARTTAIDGRSRQRSPSPACCSGSTIPTPRVGHVLQLGLGATGAHIDGDTHSHGPTMATPRVLGARCSEQARKPLKHDLPTALTLPGYPEQTQRIRRTSLTDGPIFLLDGGPRKKTTVNSELRWCIQLGKGSN